jgi:hypothetical protein
MSKTTCFIRLDAQTLHRLHSLKEDNLHGEAYQLAAQALELPDLVDTFTRINRDHNRAGWLRPELDAERRSAYEKLLVQARKLLTEEQYNQLYMCF